MRQGSVAQIFSTDGKAFESLQVGKVSQAVVGEMRAVPDPEVSKATQFTDRHKVFIAYVSSEASRIRIFDKNA